MGERAAVTEDAAGSERASRLGELVRLFGKLGIVGFGGPTAHIAMMEDEAVARRGWMPREQLVDALAATNMLPGPNSTELAIHIGYRRAGWLGGVVAGVAFIAPAFVLMIGLSWAYFRWSDIAAVADLFDGVQPAVIAVLAVTLWRLFKSSVKDVAQLAIMCATGALAYWLTSFEALILLAAGAFGVALYLAPREFPKLPPLVVVPWPLLAPAALLAAFWAWEPGTLADLTLLFLRAGGLLFGGGYVLIPLIEGDVVDGYGWLTSQQFIDGVALGQMTLGPIVITSTFVGYGAAGLPGAIVATVAAFSPAFVFAIGAGRFLDRIRSWQWARAFLRGVAPAVVGTIAAVSARLGQDALDSIAAAAIFVLALALCWRYGPIPSILFAGATGIVAGALGWTG